MTVAVGIHMIVDFYGVDSGSLSYVENMKPIFEKTVKDAKLTKISSDYYQFRPKGCSGIILLSESHLSFHTWPEYGLITLDIYTCGNPNQAYEAFKSLERALKPTKVVQCTVERGVDIPERSVNVELGTELEIDVTNL